MTTTIRQLLLELRQRLESLYRERLCEVILFGSHCRNESTPESDIDVLVVLSGQVNAADEISHTIVPVAELSLQNDVVISCMFISRQEYETGQSPLLVNITKEGERI